jgi:hypothetical protein
MEAPNIQLYNLFRLDLHLTDGKSLELMHLLDKEYKSSVKADIAALGKAMDGRFEKVDSQFEKVDARFQAIEDRLGRHDKRFDALDNKIDKNFISLDSKIDIKTAELRTEIHKSHTGIVTWMLALILTLIALIIGAMFKK